MTAVSSVVSEQFEDGDLSGYVLVTVNGRTGSVLTSMAAHNQAAAYTLIGAIESMKQELLELVAEANGAQGELSH